MDCGCFASMFSPAHHKKTRHFWWEHGAEKNQLQNFLLFQAELSHFKSLVSEAMDKLREERDKKIKMVRFRMWLEIFCPFDSWGPHSYCICNWFTSIESGMHSWQFMFVNSEDWVLCKSGHCFNKSFVFVVYITCKCTVLWLITYVCMVIISIIIWTCYCFVIIRQQRRSELLRDTLLRLPARSVIIKISIPTNSFIYI